VEGSSESALTAPFTMVITENAARKYFGNASAIGKAIQIEWGEKWYDIQVTGIVKNIPPQSHFYFDFLISDATARQIFEPKTFFTDWSANFCYTYLLIPDEHVKNEIARSITGLYARNVAQRPDSLRLQALADIHLNSHLSSELAVNGDKTNIMLAVSVAVLTLVIALINYLNIFLALNSKRGKEVGVRKALGATFSQLRRQFFFEALANLFVVVILTLIALASLFAFSSTFRSWFSTQLIDINTISMVVVILAVVFGGAFFPLLVLGRAYSLGALKVKTRSWAGPLSIKKIMVGIQSALIIIVLVLTFVFQRQIRFIERTDLGYASRDVFFIPQARAIRGKTELVRTQLLTDPSVAAVSFSSHVPSGNLNFKVPATIEGGNPDGTDEPWPISLISVDFNFNDVFQLTMKEGRFFSSDFKSDSLENYVINQSFAKAAGWNDPIGKSIETTYNVGNGTSETRKGRVVGVVNDFHFESMHKRIEPLAMIVKPFWYYYMTVRITPGSSIDGVKRVWGSAVEDIPFEYMFVTDRLERSYERDRRWSDISFVLSFIVISLGSMGVFSLISFLVQSRNKENSIRKVLGATTGGLAAGMYREIGTLVVLAGTLSLPIAYMAANKWLELFAYRVEVNIWLCLSALATLFFICCAVITTQVISGARVNPVESLRSE
jgi:putative ABC transport system permease protein